jgi:pyruvate kinase
VDAILLAGETAAGAYPVRAVHTLDRVICEAESMRSGRPNLERSRLTSGHYHAVCEAAVTLAERGDATAIVAITRGGTTARVLSALRTRVPVYAASDDPVVTRRLALAWGVVPVLAEIGDDVASTGARISEQLVASHAFERGAVVAFVSVSTDLGPGPINFVKLQRI